MPMDEQTRAPIAGQHIDDSVGDHSLTEEIDGTCFVAPRPTNRHSYVLTRIGGRLSQVADRSDNDSGDLDGDAGWFIFVEPELRIGDDVVVPDIAGYRRGRIDPAAVDYFGIAPDWVCEVLSPATAGRDRGVKRRWYFAQGVGHYWIVDPVHRTVECHARGDTDWLPPQVYSEQNVVRAAPFEATSIDLSMVWLPAS